MKLLQLDRYCLQEWNSAQRKTLLSGVEWSSFASFYSGKFDSFLSPNLLWLAGFRLDIENMYIRKLNYVEVKKREL